MTGHPSRVDGGGSADTLEGIRRFGTVLYLFAIALGLGTIIHVLRFQAIRIRELATGTNR